MPVVINEFEVVTQPEHGSQRQSATPTQQTPAQPQVREIEQIIRRQMERAARVRAH
jgi:hypothetical protein